MRRKNFLVNYWQIFVVLGVWLFASWPLFGIRFIPTHDGEYHLIRFYEFSKMIKAGNIIPRWASGLNSGYGFPLFIFHYPFPNYVGSVFHIFRVPLVQSFQISLALGMLVGALACYFFLKKEFSDKLSPVVGTILFLTIPYLYVDIYIRGSIGEVWGIAWTMVALASIAWNKKTVIALSVALLIISHNIMAMIMIPILLGYGFFFYQYKILYILVGITLASYFWIPALIEAKYMVGLNSVTYSDHFPEITQLLIPSWGSNFSQPGFVTNEMSQQIGIIASLLLAWSLLSVFLKSKSKHPDISSLNQKDNSTKRKYFLSICIIAIMLLFPSSDFIWKSLKFLQFIQYPWRLLSVLLITIPFLGAFLLQHSKFVLKWGIVACALLFSFFYMQPVTYEPRNDQYYLSRKEFTDGTSSLGNSFSTIWAPWRKERPKEHVEVVEGSAIISELLIKPTNDRFLSESTVAAILQVNRLFYPGWTIQVDSQYQSVTPNQAGVMNVFVPRGKHIVTVSFGPTADRFLANGISVVTLAGLSLSFILKKKNIIYQLET